MAGLKIAVLGTRGFPNVQGGVEKHCEKLYPILVGKGCNVSVYSRSIYVDYDKLNFRGVHLKALFTPHKKSLEAIVHTFYGLLHIFFAKKKTDLVHIHAIGPSLLVPFAKLLGFKVVITNHGPDYDRQKWGWFASMALRFGEKCGIRFADEVITVSEHINNIVRENYGRTATFIPNGVDLPPAYPAGGILTKYGLKKASYILTVGRFVPEKGFCDLVKAYNNIDCDWKLVMVGSADHEDDYSLSLKTSVTQNQNIILTGFLTGDQLGEIYANAGLFVLPSYHEGLPIVLLEAMSYGLSCLASNIPANLEVKLAAEHYFETGNIDMLATKLYFFVQHPFTSEEKSEQIELIKRKYNWNIIAEKTLLIYKKAINS